MIGNLLIDENPNISVSHCRNYVYLWIFLKTRFNFQTNMNTDNLLID